ncbi:MAG: cytochrome c biogenesis protein CcdA, partial [Vulcanimicrobiaceae bacterium]
LRCEVTEMLALGSAFVAGLGTSLGPCIAPRYIILASFITQGIPVCRALAFVIGCVGGYLVYACAGALISGLRFGTHVIYAILGLGLVWCGVRSLMTVHACSPKPRSLASFSAAFIAGLSSSMVFSPCCAPIAIGLGLQTSGQDAGMAALILLAFGLGHTLPLAAGSLAAASGMVRRCSLPGDFCATVSGALLVMVGGLYALLA